MTCSQLHAEGHPFWSEATRNADHRHEGQVERIGKTCETTRRFHSFALFNQRRRHAAGRSQQHIVSRKHLLYIALPATLLLSSECVLYPGHRCAALQTSYDVLPEIFWPFRHSRMMECRRVRQDQLAHTVDHI